MIELEIESIGNNELLDPYVKNCCKLVSKSSLSETERMYYLMKVIFEIDRLKKLECASTSTSDRMHLASAISSLRSILKDGSELLKSSSIFGEITSDDNMNRHPYIRSLESSSLSGRTYEDAAKILCSTLKVNPIAFSNFAEAHEISYPNIDKSSVEYSEGLLAARADNTSASIAKAYRWAERNVEGNPGSVDNFIAGYLQAYRVTNDEVEQERKKMIIKRIGGQDDVDNRLTKRLREMAKNNEI